MVAWLSANTRGLATCNTDASSKIGAASNTVACTPPSANNNAVNPPTKPPPIMMTSFMSSKVPVMTSTPLHNLQRVA